MKILMTDGSSNSARQTLYGLDPAWQIDVCAPSRLAQCRFSSLVNRFLRCPPIGSDPARYLAFLLRQLRSQSYDLILPTHEEVYLLSRFRERFQAEASLAVPSWEAIRHLLGKIEFAQQMHALSLPVPEFEIVTSIDQLASYGRFPFYLKRNYATAGQGVQLIRDAADRAAAIAQLDKREAESSQEIRLLAQRSANGQMCVGQAVFQHGELIAAHCAQVLEAGVGGGATFRAGVRHPEVLQHLRQLGEALQWHGAMFLEYFHDPRADRIEYIECNPRIGEPVNALLSGVDLVSALVAVSQNEQNFSFGSFGETTPGVRSHVGFIALLGRAMKGATRRELIRAGRDMAGHRGAYENAENEMTRPAVDRLSRLPAAFVLARLLVRPRAVHQLVNTTVGQYALPGSAVAAIDRLEESLFEADGSGAEG